MVEVPVSTFNSLCYFNVANHFKTMTNTFGQFPSNFDVPCIYSSPS